MISPRIDKPRTAEEARAVSCHRPYDQINGPPYRIKAKGACSRIAMIKNKKNRLRKFGHILTSIHGQRIASATITTMIAATDHFCVVADLSSSCSFCCHSDLYRLISAELLDSWVSVVFFAHHSSHLSVKHRVESWYTPDETSCFKFCDASKKALCRFSVRSLTTGLVSHQFPVPLCSIAKPSTNVPCSYVATKIFSGGTHFKAWTSVVLKKNTFTKTATDNTVLKTFLDFVAIIIKKFLPPRLKYGSSRCFSPGSFAVLSGEAYTYNSIISCLALSR